MRAFSQQLGDFKNSLARFEKHLQLRNFLVGYQLTLADAYLVNALAGPFKLMFDKKTRMAKFANLTRYVSLILGSFHFEQVYGPLVLCKKTATPPAPVAAPKEAAKDSKDAKKDLKEPKEAKKDSKKEEPKKKPAP